MNWHCWSDHTPSTAQTVAKAFYAGKTRKRGNCETDGTTYRLFGNAIARRVPDDQLTHRVTMALLHGQPLRKLEFSFRGWPTKTTCRHLDALGVRASYAGGEATMNGKPVHVNEWYTLEELEAIPVPAPVVRAPRNRFVNLTAELFPC